MAVMEKEEMEEEEKTVAIIKKEQIKVQRNHRFKSLLSLTRTHYN